MKSKIFKFIQMTSKLLMVNAFMAERENLGHCNTIYMKIYHITALFSMLNAM
jgi:hypothetical protein